MYYMLLIFLMMFYLTNTTKTQVDTDLSIVRYEHGISLQNTGSIAALKAEWTILVLLQKPALDNRMFIVTHSLKQMLLATNITVDPNVRRNWFRRMKWTLTMLHRLSKPKHVSLLKHRSKRAPLGFIADLSHVLFGTVTETQLNEYRQAVNLALKSTNKTIHLVNSLITVTKHFRLQTQENLHRISNLASYINNFRTSVIRQFAVLQHYVSRISFQVNFEHLLVSLEQATYLYSCQMDAY